MKLKTWVAVFATSALALAGCSAGSSSSDGASEGSGEVRDDMVIAFTAEPANLDFTSTAGAAIPQALMENVYESLVRIDQNGDLQPALAKDWTVSDDRLTYTFNLNEGVTFSNGDELTAEDVKFSYDRVPEWGNALKSRMDGVESVTAVDDLTVEIKLEQPSNSWLLDLASFVGAVFSTDGVDDLANTPIGSGPFSMAEWKRGQSIEFAQRDDYWGESPALETVTFNYYKDAISASNALKGGEVDVISNLQAPELAGTYEEDDTFTVINGTSNGEVVLGMNNAEGVFADEKVRQAVMYGIDRQAVLDTAWAGYGTLIGSMVPPTDPYYEDLTGVYPYDVEAAKKLIAEAGVEGETVKFTVPNLPYATAISEIVSSQLQEIGLNATVETQEFPAVWLDETFTKKNYDMSVINHVEARDILTVFNKDSYIGYDNADLMATADQADQGTEEEYVDGMKEVARTITDDAAANFLFLFPNLVVANANVTGVPENAVSDAFPIAELGWK